MLNAQEQKITESLALKLDRTKELAAYCYSCGKCSVVCPTSILGVFSPKNFIHNFVTKADVDLDKFVIENDLFNCLTCEQCAIYCPMALEEKGKGVLVAEIVQSVREYGFERGILGDQLSKCATHDGIMQIYPKVQSDVELAVNNIDFIKENSFLTTADKGEIAYFAGCSALMQDVFESYNVNYRDTALGVITLLNEANITPVVLATKCCGHDNYWTGDSATARKLAEYNIKLYQNAGVKKIIVNCAEGYRMWKVEYPQMFPDIEFEVIHFSDFMVKNNMTKLLVPSFPIKTKVTYHDPCRLGRLGGGLYDEPRKILESIPGVKLVEMENIKENANCCGVSGFKCCNSDTKNLRVQRIDEAIDTGAEYLITTCPKCVTHFNCYLSEKDMDGNSNPKAEKIKVMELSAFITKITQKI